MKLKLSILFLTLAFLLIHSVAPDSRYLKHTLKHKRNPMADMANLFAWGPHVRDSDMRNNKSGQGKEI